MDEAAFVGGVARTRAVLGCLAQAVDATLAARVHRVEGLAAFAARDNAAAMRDFAAARALDPTWTFPGWMVPAGHPLHGLYAALPTDAATLASAAPKRGIELYFDGGAERPAAAPTIFQALGEATPTTARVLPGEPLPDYPLRGEGLRRPLLVVAGAAAVASGGLFVANAVMRESVYPGSDAGSEPANFVVTNTLGAGALTLGAASVGTGAGAFLFARW